MITRMNAFAVLPWKRFATIGVVEMGGMFSVVKVREGLASGDYKNPGWFKHSEGTVAFEWKGESKAAIRAPEPDFDPAKTTEIQLVKPGKGSDGGHDNP